jgi:hypothetical protein
MGMGAVWHNVVTGTRTLHDHRLWGIVTGLGR